MNDDDKILVDKDELLKLIQLAMKQSESEELYKTARQIFLKLTRN